MPEGPTSLEREKNHGYQLFMLTLCVFALAALAIEKAAPLTPEARALIQYADFVICLLFFGDFVYSLATARDRWRYLRTWGWVDLLSSIPMIDAFRAGRLARILRILRVLRGIKATRLLLDFVLNRRAQSAVLAATLVTILVVMVGGASVLHFEDATDSNIKTPEDAVWWSLVTLTTVGYGDRFPVTSEGRLVGALLMIMGVALVGTFSGLAASWFLSPVATRNRSEIELLRAELADLRRLLEPLAEASRQPKSTAPSSTSRLIDPDQPGR
jgi:voltage-gated potassium channel